MCAERTLRKRLLRSLAIAAVVALVLGLVATIYVLSQRLAQERALAATEHARAQAAQRRAEVVSKFVLDSFSQEITSREILDQSLALMRSQLSAPGRKEYVEAERRYREAIAMYERTLPPGSSFTAAALTVIGRQQLDLGRPQEAEATLNRALNQWSTDYGPATAWYAHAHAVLGRALAVQRRFAEAEPALIETYPVLVRTQLDDQLVASVRGWIEDLYRDTGRPQQAQVYFQQLRTQLPTVQK